MLRHDLSLDLLSCMAPVLNHEAIKEYGGSGGKVPCILDLGTLLRLVEWTQIGGI